MTPAERVLDAAAAVAWSAPKRKGAHVYSAQVPWKRIEELRDALDALDVDWRGEKHR